MIKSAIHSAYQAQKYSHNRKHQDQTFAIDSLVFVSTKILKLCGICKLYPWFLGPFSVISKIPSICCVDIPLGMAVVYLYFHTSHPKPFEPHPSRLPALEYDSY